MPTAFPPAIIVTVDHGPFKVKNASCLDITDSIDDRNHSAPAECFNAIFERAVVERLVHWTPNQEVASLNPDGGLNFRVSVSALSTAL